MLRTIQPTCYIHIGPHKTGSSSLKHFLRANEIELERRGLFFPRSINQRGKRARNHIDLLGRGEIDDSGNIHANAQLWPEIENAIDEKHPNILISSEMFTTSFSSAELFDPILSFFEARGYRIVVIAYVRDQPAWLNSWYVQSQKRLKRMEDFDYFVERSIEEGRVEPSRYLAPFLENSRCVLDIVSFEQAAAAGLEDDFIRRCGIEDTGSLAKTAIRNTNAGAKTVYAAGRIMKELGGSLGEHDNYRKIYRSFKKQSVEHGWDRVPYVALDEHRYNQIRARFETGNDEFAKTHFGRTWNELCPKREIYTSKFDPVTAPEAELEEIDAVVDKIVKLAKRKPDADRLK